MGTVGPVSIELRTLSARDLTAAEEPLARGFLESVGRGFHEARSKDESARHWLDAARADAMMLRGAWLPDEAYGAGPMPIATFAALDKTLNLGARMLPVRMITDITVSPAHRRQGWLRRMMTADLADAVERGVPIAALTVSEATIYGRFGFAPATRAQHIEVDTSSRFGLRDFTDPGRVELVEPEQAWPAVQRSFARFHAITPGSIDRPSFYAPILRGELDFGFRPGNDRLRAAVHLDADGEPDGHLLYQLETEGDEQFVAVMDLVAPDPQTHLALWRFLAGIDLVTKVRMRRARLDDPLRWALEDLFCYRTTAVVEHIWLRVLDVAEVLGARPWAADGSLVLGVDDPLGHAAGTWTVTVVAGSAVAAPTDAVAEVRVTAETLASLSLGGIGVRELAAAGRVSGTPEAIARLAAMSDAVRPPYSVTSF